MTTGQLDDLIKRHHTNALDDNEREDMIRELIERYEQPVPDWINAYLGELKTDLETIQDTLKRFTEECS